HLRLIYQAHAVIRETAQRFGLDTYPNQLEIITAEQMMDAYASVGMPVNYRHWSYGKEFISTEKNYRRGHMGLAYEIVINSNPCISYLMEENTMAMQALAGAGAGAPRRARGLCAAPDQRHVAHSAAQGARRQGRRRRRGAGPPLPRGTAGEPAVLHREERAAARTLAARGRAHRAQGG